MNHRGTEATEEERPRKTRNTGRKDTFVALLTQHDNRKTPNGRFHAENAETQRVFPLFIPFLERLRMSILWKDSLRLCVLCVKPAFWVGFFKSCRVE
jgi:hypothetical protein